MLLQPNTKLNVIKKISTEQVKLRALMFLFPTVMLLEPKK